MSTFWRLIDADKTDAPLFFVVDNVGGVVTVVRLLLFTARGQTFSTRSAPTFVRASAQRAVRPDLSGSAKLQEMTTTTTAARNGAYALVPDTTEIRLEIPGWWREREGGGVLPEQEKRGGRENTWYSCALLKRHATVMSDLPLEL